MPFRSWRLGRRMPSQVLLFRCAIAFTFAQVATLLFDFVIHEFLAVHLSSWPWHWVQAGMISLILVPSAWAFLPNLKEKEARDIQVAVIGFCGLALFSFSVSFFMTLKI